MLRDSFAGELPSVFVMLIFTGNFPGKNKVVMVVVIEMFTEWFNRNQINIISFFFYMNSLISSSKQIYLVSKIVQYKEEETETQRDHHNAANKEESRNLNPDLAEEYCYSFIHSFVHACSELVNIYCV